MTDDLLFKTNISINDGRRKLCVHYGVKAKISSRDYINTGNKITFQIISSFLSIPWLVNN